MLPTTEFLHALEAARTQSLVDRNIELALRLHAPEYWLITPGGKTFNRESYLGAIGAGTLQYISWEIAEFSARTSQGMAMVRYQARLEFPSGKLVNCWHTDSYEQRGDLWQAVWSQATAIMPDVPRAS